MIPPPAYRGGANATGEAYVYLLQSVSTGSFYLGWTTDLQRRLDHHNAAGNGYTNSRGPWELLAYELHPSAEAAKQRERLLKRRHRMRLFFTKRALAVPKGSAMGGPRQVGG